MRFPMSICSILGASLLIALAGGVAGAADKAGPDYVIGEFRVQTMKGGAFLYVSCQTSMADIAKSITESVDLLNKQSEAAGIHFTGPCTFVYHSFKPEGKFEMEVGFPVSADTKPPGDLKVRNLEAFRCATLLYTGVPAHIGEAYSKLFEQLIAAGYTPTEESREMTLYWEGVDSPNDVTQIMVGLQ